MNGDPLETVRAYDRAVARLSRRDWMRIVGSVGTAALARPPVSRTLLAQPTFTGYPFTLGVASGDPHPDGVVLWTRLAPQPLEGGGMPMVAVDVGWELSEDAGFRRVVRKGTAHARPELGHSVHVELDGLDAGREYWYRFHAGSEVSQTGRTKTAPAPSAPVEEIRFGICGCSNYEMGYFTALQHMARDDFDFVVHTGDYIYEGRGTTGRVRQHLGDEVYTVEDYRGRYALYKADPDFIAVHAATPFIVTWDDHEVDNDYAADADERGTPPEVFLLRRAAAYQAYYEAMPLRVAAMPSGPHMRLYRRLRFGQLLDLSMLDTRQWRSRQACGGGHNRGCAEALDQTRTILGREQERWLFEGLAGTRATWTILGQQVPTYPRDVTAANPSARYSMDKWDGYAVSRDRLYRRLLETRAPNPVVLSGDVHAHFGADLKLDFLDPKSQTVGVELTNTSITSNGDGSEVTGNWEQTRPDNPHIKYHSARRGYIACTATAKTLRADFRVLDRVTVPGEPVRTAGTLVIEAGKPGATLA